MSRALSPWIASCVLQLLARAETHAQVREPFNFEGAPRLYRSDEHPFNLIRPEALAMAILDFDDDGDADLVRALEGSVIDIAENRGGRYHTSIVLELSGWGYSPLDVATGDFNGDGHQDIAIAGYLLSPLPIDGVIRILQGDGQGQFSAQPDVVIHDIIPCIEAADVDGDGLDDVIAANCNASVANETGVFIVHGNGTLSRFEVGFLPCTALAHGDLNGDGYPEIAVLQNFGNSSFIHTFFNDGTGGFPNPALQLGPLIWPWGLLLADADGDGDRDITTTENEAAPGRANVTVSVFENDGQGGFPSSTRSEVLHRSWAATDIEASFVDDDDIVDLVLSLRISREGTPSGLVTTLKGLGGLRFEAINSVSFVTADIELADVDVDQTREILGAEGQVVPVRRDGRLGGISLPRDVGLRPPDVLLHSTILDFNKDSLQDVALLNELDQVVECYLSDGEGSFSSPILLPYSLVDGYGRLESADLNADGWADFLLIANGSSNVVVLLNNRLGGVEPPIRTNFDLCSACHIFDLAIGDLNHDGYPDLVLSDKHHRDGAVGLGTGDGRFLSQGFLFPETPGFLALGELTGDDHLDVAHVGRETYPSSAFFVLPGQGDGSFSPPIESIFQQRLASALALGDTDNDNDNDVVVSLSHEGLAFLRNDGSGTFSLGQLIDNTETTYDELHLVDLNKDDALDVLARVNHVNIALAAFENRAGTFNAVSPEWEVGADGLGKGFEVQVGDVDGDTADDIVISCTLVDASHPQAFVYLNASNLRRTGYAMAGARTTFALDAPTSPGQPYLLFVSSMGAWPGTDIGLERLPVNFDPTLMSLVLNGGAGLFSGFLGRLDALGRATAVLDFPPGLPPGLVVDLDFAFVSVDGGVPASLRTSNNLGMTLR